MMWPGQFSNTSLFYALHDKSKPDAKQTNGWRISRYRFFLYVTIGAFVWYWVPGVLWQGLSVFAFVTCESSPHPNQSENLSADRRVRDQTE